MTAPDPARAVGRPRNPRSDEAILDATRELLAEGGVAGLTVEGVAARAGVAKTTVYRRWRSKDDLALALLIDLAERMMPVVDLGDARAELVALVESTIRALSGTLMGRVMQGLVSELARHPDLARAFEEQVVRLRREEVGRVVDRGIARGDLRPDADYELAPELLVGPVYYRLLLSHAPLDVSFAARVVDAVLPSFVDTRTK
jgi:AcrR family transcriptional regulator